MRRFASVHRFRLVIAASVAAIALMIAVLHATIGIAVRCLASTGRRNTTLN